MKKNTVKTSASDRFLLIFFYIFIGLFAIVCLYPLLLAVGTSFP